MILNSFVEYPVLCHEILATGLHFIMRVNNGHLGIVHLLLDSGADIEANGFLNQTLLYFAAKP